MKKSTSARYGKKIQLVFSSFLKDSQLGSARLAKCPARLGSARGNPAPIQHYFLVLTKRINEIRLGWLIWNNTNSFVRLLYTWEYWLQPLSNGILFDYLIPMGLKSYLCFICFESHKGFQILTFFINSLKFADIKVKTS